MFDQDVAKTGKTSKVDEALDEAFRHRRAAVHAVAARAGSEEAADLVQDAFLKTVEAGRTANIDSPFGFLLRVARNGVIDRLRKRGRWAKLVSEGSAESDRADPAPDAERAAIASERLQRALACIESMPPRRREVLLLLRLEGLTYRKVAMRLGISPKTVENHLSAAMEELSRAMARYDACDD